MTASQPTGERRHQALYILLMLVILLAATTLRVHGTQQWPPGLSHDEAVNGMDAVRILQTGSFPTYRADGRPEPLFRYVQAITVGLFGPTRFGLRMASVFTGLLSVAAAARAARHLASPDAPARRRWLAVASAATLAVLVGHVSISRVAYRAILLPFALFMFFDSLVAAWNTGRLSAFAWAGGFLALSLHSYTAGIVALGALPILVAHQAIFDRPVLKQRLKGLLVLLGVFAIAIAPLLILVAIQPTIYQRASELGGQPESLAAVEKAGLLLDDLRRTARSFYREGDINPQYNVFRAPLLHTRALVALFGLGLVQSLSRPRRLTGPLLLGLLVGFTLPVALAGEIPHGLRISGEFFVIPLLVASGIGLSAWGVARLPRLQTLASTGLAVGMAAVFVHAGVRSGQLYFSFWEQDLTFGQARVQMFSWFFEGPRTAMAEFVAEQDGPVYLPLLELDHPTLRYLTMRSHPNVTTFADRVDEAGGLTLPAGTFVLPPMNFLTGSYALLEPDGTITLLPRLDDETLAALGTAQHSSDTVFEDRFGVETATLVSFPPDGEPIRMEPAVAYPNWADYEGQVRLVGWSGPTRLPEHLEGAERFEFTLYLQAGPEQHRDLDVFAQVWTLDDERIGGRDAPVNRWLYPSSLWQPGDIVPVTLRFPLAEEPTDMPVGGYRLVVGLNDAWGRRLAAADTGGELIGDVAYAGGLKVAGDETPDLSAMQPTHWQLGDTIELVGFRLEWEGEAVSSLGPGDEAILLLAWQATVKPPTDYIAFFHLLDGEGNLVTQFDVEPADGLYPTSTWDAGDTFLSVHPVAIPSEAAEGPYEFLVGLYAWPSLERLPVKRAGEDIALEDGRIPLLTLPDL